MRHATFGEVEVIGEERIDRSDFLRIRIVSSGRVVKVARSSLEQWLSDSLPHAQPSEVTVNTRRTDPARQRTTRRTGATVDG